MAVDKVDGTSFTLSNRGQLVLPTAVEAPSVTAQDAPAGAGGDLESQGTYVWNSGGSVPIAAVTVDPDHVLPDDDRSNNRKTAP